MLQSQDRANILFNDTMQDFMSRFEGVNKAAWQAFGAIQALLSREAVLKDLTLNELQSLFRCEECHESLSQHRSSASHDLRLIPASSINGFL